MKTVDKAKQLAESLVMTAKKFNKKCRAVLTSMEQPLGSAVGNSLEVLETIEFLKGDRADDLNKVVMALGAQMLLIGGIAESPHEAERLLELSIVDGKALQKFAEMVRLHGGNPDIVEDSSLLKTAPVKQAFTATRDGYISGFETMKIGLAVNGLGAGRNRIAGPNGGDRIDPGVGFKIYKKIGDFLRRGDTIAEIFAACQSDAEKALDELSRAVSITDSPPKSPNIIYEIIPLLSG
jgi:pyrimidine-nucleoside phosphorylase